MHPGEETRNHRPDNGI